MTAPTQPTDPESRLRALDLAAHVADPHLKQRFVTPMFEVIAPRYDRFTRVFSFGRDRGWKRELLTELQRVPGTEPTILDLACGTGDLGLGAQQARPRARVFGFDVARRMLAIARDRSRVTPGRTRYALVAADMTRLPLGRESADVVLAGYAVRNAPDPRAVIDEIIRVLKPGGELLLLDFYRPENPVWRRLFLEYLRMAGNLIGWLWHRHSPVYGYIAASIEHHVSAEEMCALLIAHGFRTVTVRRKLFGGIAVHVARLAPA